MSVKKIMVMCTGNSFRSHMAQAYLHTFAQGNVEVYSAGVQASGKVYPWAVKLMAEEGIDIAHHTSNQIEKYFDISFDFLITVCDNAQETCPFFPKPVGKKIHHSFKDYAPQNNLSDEEYMKTLRPIRDAIKVFCKDFVKTYLS